MYQVSDLTNVMSKYLDPHQIDRVFQAYQFSAKAHEGQQRISGEPYIHHPLEVAGILGEMHMDHQTLMAAILHDVIEDTPTAKDDIRKKFGKNVAELVDGVSKLTQIKFDTVEEAQAQNFRKMLMAMSNDIRVILVKLADRLHNMRTLGSLPREKRVRIARETLEIYVPIAQRLGLNNIRLELEELGFSTMYPMRHRILVEQVRKARGNRKEVVTKIRNALRRRMRQEKLPVEIHGREKHLYGIYEKMRRNKLTFDEVYDVYAFRILVEDVDTCYRALGVVHNLYKPVPGKFKDYIAIPKTNGYQSLHTVLFGPFGVHIEVQIRTREMNDVAEAGIAAHWMYKSGKKSGDGSGAHRKAREWLQRIMEMQKTAGNPQEFLENVKIDLFPDAVYLFTPKGKIIELPKGATAVDFAYAIHTDVGDTCTGARINRRLAPLGTRLYSGQSVEIITSPEARPNPGWLKFVATARARASIRHYLKNLKEDEAIALGLRLLNRELDLFGYRYDQIQQTKLKEVLKEYRLDDDQALLAEVGLGNRIAPLIARRLIETDSISTKLTNKDTISQPFVIKGTEGMVVQFPKCCYPIPGDPIVGFSSAGRGIVIHYRSCKNIAEYRNQPEKWIDVEWEENIDRDFVTTVRMHATNQRGVLATVAAAVSEQEANILNVDIEDKDDRDTLLVFEIEVRNRQHLAQIIKRIRRIKHISHISR
ncbi:MAG: bifunctional (p)ppGpp synthetase/guanosine-3',5'-bis(diphosphate) 3'-pyrophosphohydrolase [Proteobacteria bacterium]|nr:bifunctional (p)ppGpp synthetase/guanosine-3',5'-bis(diphosphate) 3'-pyrophosphohydrolase [Pseudomonadota bacterium]